MENKNKETKIEQINTIYDDRFYTEKGKINSRTELPFFPSSTTILPYLPVPEPVNLQKWRAELGYQEALRYMQHRAEIGSYVHNLIEQSIKMKLGIKFEKLKSQILFDFPMNVDQLFIFGALRGWINFLKEEEPEILMCEKSFCYRDYAGTADLICRFKSDKYQKDYLVDLKTSKQANEHHYIQVASYQNAFNIAYGAVLVLGNSTKKKFTLTKIPQNKYDTNLSLFYLAKEGFYISNPNASPKYVEPFDFKTPESLIKLGK